MTSALPVESAKLLGKNAFSFPASPTAKTSRACQSGPGTPIPPTTPFTQSNATLAEGPRRGLAGRRQGACSADSRRILPKTEAQREEPTSPYRPLMRPKVEQMSNPNQLFFTRPRPPMMPKPFHNLPNFRKPGSVPPQEHGTPKQQHRCSERQQQSRRHSRTPLKIPTTAFEGLL